MSDKNANRGERKTYMQRSGTPKEILKLYWIG